MILLIACLVFAIFFFWLNVLFWGNYDGFWDKIELDDNGFWKGKNE